MGRTVIRKSKKPNHHHHFCTDCSKYRSCYSYGCYGVLFKPCRRHLEKRK